MRKPWMRWNPTWWSISSSPGQRDSSWWTSSCFLRMGWRASSSVMQLSSNRSLSLCLTITSTGILVSILVGSLYYRCKLEKLIYFRKLWQVQCHCGNFELHGIRVWYLPGGQYWEARVEEGTTEAFQLRPRIWQVNKYKCIISDQWRHLLWIIRISS